MTDTRVSDAALERDLAELLAAGPRRAPGTTVERALARARQLEQRRPAFGRLDRRAWPPRRGTLSDPAFVRLARVGAAALLVLLVAALLAVGARLLDRPPSIDIEHAGAIDTRSRGDLSLRLWPDGRLLVGSQFLFDLATGTASDHAIAGQPGSVSTAYPLEDGRVVVIYQPSDGGPGARDAVGLLDPATGTVTLAGALPPDRFQHSQLVLRDGRILSTGGVAFDPETGATTMYADVDLFDPATGTSTTLAPLPQPRYRHSMLELPDGRILIAGGQNADAPDPKREVRDVELYDLRTGTSTVVGAMVPMVGPYWVRMAQLGDGRVLMLGATEVVDPCGSLPPASGSPPGLPSSHATAVQHTYLFDPARREIVEGPVLPWFYTDPLPLGGGRALVFGQERTFPGGCAGDDEPRDTGWLGIVDFATDAFYRSRNAATGEGTLEVDAATIYGSGVVLRDGRVALLEAASDDLDPRAVDVLAIR